MSVWSTISGWFNRPLVNVTFTQDDVAQVLGQSPAQLYATQPHLRTVISFMGDNVAQVGLQLFNRESDTNRVRVTDDPLNDLLNRPNPDMTQFELLRSLVCDIALYDVAYWIVVQADSPSGWMIRPIPPSWVTMKKQGDVFSPQVFTVDPEQGHAVDIKAEDMIVFHGWNPCDPASGVSPIRALKDVVAEQIQAWSYRTQMWKRGGRIGMYLSRPKDAPNWDDKARERFQRDWKEYQDNGGKAGSSPLLEDGMTMNRVGFSAREDEFLEVTKLSLQTVAQVYHVNPVMVGILDNANFSNTKEFRKMLYSETLGPLMQMVQDRLNTFLVPRVSKASSPYLEFNIQSKLAGDFEEQASVLSTSIGAPWMTVNEGRERQNLPELEGGDRLRVPLNVTEGGQSSPQDGGDPLPDVVDDVVKRWFARMKRSNSSRKAAGESIDWKRWERELQADLVSSGIDQFNAGMLAKQTNVAAMKYFDSKEA